MKTYEIVVKKDRKYGLEKSPYVMGRIIGILEGSGADVMYIKERLNRPWLITALFPDSVLSNGIKLVAIQQLPLPRRLLYQQTM